VLLVRLSKSASFSPAARCRLSQDHHLAVTVKGLSEAEALSLVAGLGNVSTN